MNKIFKKFNYLIIINLVIVTLFFYFWVFSPLKKELEITLKNNFTKTVSITEMNIENKFSRFIEGAESLSSRTMIRNKLYEFKTNKINFKQLQEYTKDKYNDGANVLENVVVAFRLTNNRVISQSGNDDFKKYINYFNYKNKDTQIKVIKSECLVLVNSLIKKNDDKIGRDIVIYDIQPIMNAIDKENLNCEIIYNKNIPKNYETDQNLVEYRQILDTNYWLKLEQSKSDLYFSLNNLSFKILIGFIILFLSIIIIFYKVINITSEKVISELKNKITKITKISETDNMLGIYNRSKFFKFLNKEISRCSRYNNNLSLIMIDVDKFKAINDNFGHRAGDKVLIKLAKIISNEIRENDLFARYGGDEFMIVLPETNLEKATKLGKRLRKIIIENEFSIVKDLTCSFGITQFKNEDDIDSLIKRVDRLLYKSKEKRDNISYSK